MKLQIAYFGTPDFSARFLEKILQDKDLPVEVKLIVTQPDRRVGRDQILTPSPVKLIGKKYNIDVFEKLDLFENYDLGLLFAYGQIIPAKLLQTPKMGFWNIHPSPLPYYRGPSPIAYPLILGDKITGITIFKMDEKLDHGPIISQEKIKILKSEKRPDLTNRLTDVGYELFKKIICKLKNENWDLEEKDLIKQKESEATYTRKLSKSDGFIPLPTLKKSLNNEALTHDELPIILKESKKIENCKLKIENSAELVFNLFRGLYPWPGIWTTVELTRLRSEAGKPSQLGGNIKRLKITDIELSRDNSRVVPTISIKRVQLEGKNEVDFDTFNKAYSLF